MTTTQQGIITLLKSAVTGEKLPLPEGFDLSDAWPMIRKHSIAPLAFEGAVNCGIPRNDPAMQTLFQAYCRSLQHSEGQLRDLDRIFAAFEETGIDYMPLKGVNMKPRYPRPELRPMGDADILIRMEQYETVRTIMTALGFFEKNETDHELHWETPALHAELHKRLIPSYNKDYDPYFGDGWQLGKIRDGHRHAMTPEDELVYLFTHFAKHYRDGGIGTRHVLDLWVFLRTFPLVNETWARGELEKLQLLEFYDNILRLIDCWFGAGQWDEKMEILSDSIFASGSFGPDALRVISRAVRDTKHGGSGRLVYLWQMAFPSAMVLRDKYTVLKKAPWLLPAVWIYRPFYKVFRERDSLKEKERHLEVLDEENIRARQQMLNYVGLDYNF